MSEKCRQCDYGPEYDPSSDFCDGCMSDPDTGWYGFTDHRVGKHFDSKEEQIEYYKTHNIDDDEETEYTEWPF